MWRPYSIKKKIRIWFSLVRFSIHHYPFVINMVCFPSADWKIFLAMRCIIFEKLIWTRGFLLTILSIIINFYQFYITYPIMSHTAKASLLFFIVTFTDFRWRHPYLSTNFALSQQYISTKIVKFSRVLRAIILFRTT